MDDTKVLKRVRRTMREYNRGDDEKKKALMPSIKGFSDKLSPETKKNYGKRYNYTFA